MMPTVRDVELVFLRQFEKALKEDDEDRIAELRIALKVLRDYFSEDLVK